MNRLKIRLYEFKQKPIFPYICEVFNCDLPKSKRMIINRAYEAIKHPIPEWELEDHAAVALTRIWIGLNSDIGLYTASRSHELGWIIIEANPLID